MSEMKEGRGRRYDFQPDSARFGDYARYVALLDEHAQRLTDLIADIPDDAGNHIPEWGENSIWWLCQHMCLAEQHWFVRLGGIAASCDAPRIDGTWTRQQVLAAIEAVRPPTKAYLQAMARGEAAFTPAGAFTSLTQLLEHLNWHWVYHTGQVGTMRRLTGHRYKWTYS